MSKPETFFIHWKGDRSGPYTFDEIQLLVQTRKIGPLASVETHAGRTDVMDFIASPPVQAIDQPPLPILPSPENPDADAQEQSVKTENFLPESKVTMRREAKRTSPEVLPLFVGGVTSAIVSLIFIPWLFALLAIGAAVWLLARQRLAPGITLIVLTAAFFAFGSRGSSTSKEEQVASIEAMELPALRGITKPAVVQVVTGNENGEITASGSGFFITPHVVVTNYHVVAGAVHVGFVLDDRTPSLCVEFLYQDELRDLAVLRSEKASSAHLNLETNQIEEGERVAIIGSPLGFDGTLSDGIVSAVRKDEQGIELVQISAPISPGSSGSPVVNRFGKVIGVATMIHTGGQSLNFAVSSRELDQILKKINNQAENNSP